MRSLDACLGSDNLPCTFFTRPGYSSRGRCSPLQRGWSSFRVRPRGCIENIEFSPFASTAAAQRLNLERVPQQWRPLVVSRGHGSRKLTKKQPGNQRHSFRCSAVGAGQRQRKHTWRHWDCAIALNSALYGSNKDNSSNNSDDNEDDNNIPLSKNTHSGQVPRHLKYTIKHSWFAPLNQ